MSNPGMLVRLTVEGRHYGDHLRVGRVGIVSEPDEYTGSDETLVNFPQDNGNEHWVYVKPDEFEPFYPEAKEVDLAMDSAPPKSYGEVIDVAINRTKRASLRVGSLGATEEDKNLRAALRVLVPMILLSSNPEQVLRELVGE